MADTRKDDRIDALIGVALIVLNTVVFTLTYRALAPDPLAFRAACHVITAMNLGLTCCFLGYACWRMGR